MVFALAIGYQLLYAWSLTETTVVNSEVLHSLTPLFTTLVRWMFLGQQLVDLVSLHICATR
ncbi:MAG: EamA family transporter [Okeania sp. SIO3B3]|nr:EamA family transporter [Okeania sp. SIO3B3]